MADVFLSYAHADRQKAEELARTLKGAGWTVFWDRVMRSGPRFRDVIARELESAKCVVVLWSPSSVQSDWVIDEAEEARTGGRLVPAVIEPVKPPHGFRGLQTANLVNWNSGSADAEFDLLISGIEAHAPREAPTAPDPTSAPPEIRDIARQNLTPAERSERDVVRHEELPGADRPAALSIPPSPPSAVTEPTPITRTDDERPLASVTPASEAHAGRRGDELSGRQGGDAGRPVNVEEAPGLSIDSGPVKPPIPSVTERRHSGGTTDVEAGTAPQIFRRDRRVLAMAVAALVVAGIIAVAILNNSKVPADLGFDPTGLVMMEVTLPVARYTTSAELAEGFKSLLMRVSALPGVTAAAAVDVEPTRESNVNCSIGTGPVSVKCTRVMGDYFQALGIPLVMARGFNRDRPEYSPAAIISQALMDSPSVVGTSPTVNIEGRAGGTAFTIIGVVLDVRSREVGGTRRPPHIYIQAALDPVRRMTILAKMVYANRLETGRLALRQALTGFDPQLPTPRIDDMQAVVSATMSEPRFGTAVVALLGLVAALLLVFAARGLMLYASRRVPVV